MDAAHQADLKRILEARRQRGALLDARSMSDEPLPADYVAMTQAELRRSEQLSTRPVPAHLQSPQQPTPASTPLRGKVAVPNGTAAAPAPARGAAAASGTVTATASAASTSRPIPTSARAPRLFNVPGTTDSLCVTCHRLIGCWI